MGGYVIVIPARAAVIGLGASGRSARLALLQRGCEVLVFDQRASAADVAVIADSDPAILANAIIAWEPDVVVVSPGIPVSSPLVSAVREAELPLWGEVELAWRLQESGSHQGRPWLCVTGTNGKTTTVGIVTSILSAAGERVAEVGNVGLPITSQIDTDASVFAVELSSFQLETATSLRPEASVCLNVDADHLDWHGSVDHYRRAKGRVYDGAQRARFFFQGDTVVYTLAQNAARTTAPLIGIGGEGYLSQQDHRVSDASGLVADLEQVPFLRDRGYPTALVSDALAAIALAQAHGVTPMDIQRGLATFELDAHRQSLVAEQSGIRWIDDSKATNSHAAAAALRDVAPGTAVWVAGGDPKGQDFDSLIPCIMERLRAVILIGADRGPLRQALSSHAPDTTVIEVDGCGNPAEWMGTVVAAAAQHAHVGDTVILAPACASWDQFDSYAQRGDIFAAAVHDALGGGQ